MDDAIDLFASQLAQKNFASASATLKQLLKQNPEDSQVQILVARFHFATGKPDQAETIYRRILRSESQNKLLTQARQGLKAIEDAEIQARRDRMAISMAKAGSKGLAFLAIQPVAPDARKAVAEKLARIFRIDNYTAQIQIPSRYQRIFRIGLLGELSSYGEELCAAGVPAIWVSLDSIAKISVYTVDYFKLTDIHRLHAVCGEEEVTFDLSEIKRRVVGQIPTFGEIVTVNAKHKLVRKDDILDQIRICDLHLPKRNCILRFHEGQYQFDRGMQLEVHQTLKHIAPTVQERWAALTKWFDQSLVSLPNSVPIYDEFVPFAEMSIDFPEFLKELISHIDLERQKPSLWDNCFQLYSGSIFQTEL